jgi:hypothetical protein
MIRRQSRTGGSPTSVDALLSIMACALAISSCIVTPSSAPPELPARSDESRV